MKAHKKKKAKKTRKNKDGAFSETMGLNLAIPGLGYWYKARLVRVVDGDTYVFLVDLGFRAFRQESIRLKGFDTPELRPRKKGRTRASRSKEKIAAIGAKSFANDRLDNAYEIRIHTEKGKMTFNRYVADVWYREGLGYGTWKSMAKELEKAGYAK